MPDGENDDVMAQIRRSMSPYWNSSESGGAYLSAAGHEEAESVEIYKTLLCFFPEIDQASEDKWYFIAGKILPPVEDFFHTYRLVPGLYSITNNLRFW